jgi:hypothetical protein
VQLPQVVRRSADAILGPSGEIVSRAAVSTMGVDGWWQWAPLQEPYTGAFQQGFQTERNEQVLAFSAVFACVSLRANDIAKLRIKLVEYLTGRPGYGRRSMFLRSRRCCGSRTAIRRAFNS